MASMNSTNLLQGYKELYKFFYLMGSVFESVAREVLSKVTVLETFLSGDHSQQYRTVQSMIEYETNNSLSNGSKTLLQLHRGLGFIAEFTGKMEVLEDETELGPTAERVYEDTLMKYHSWLVQKTAKIALGLLPTKKELIMKIVPDFEPEKVEKVREDFPIAVKEMKETFVRVEEIYREYDLLNII